MATLAADRRPLPRPRIDGFALLAAPGLLYLGIFFALPLAILLFRSVQGPDGALSFAGYVEFFSEPLNLIVTWRTFRVAILSTLLSLVLAYPTAFVLARAKGLVQTIILMAMILPLSVGVIVKAFSWSIVLRSDGIVNSALVATGIVEAPIRLLFTETALVIGAANVFLPFMVLPIYAVVRQIDPSLGSAAATLGAGPFYRFFRVTLPLTLPGVIAGVAFVFSLTISMYVIPSLIVGERQSTLSMLIARSFLFYRDAQLGSTISAILLVIAIAVVLGSSWLMRRFAGERA
ncbi:ABC transporter permease [Acuticoccus kandeliae]|uniref:ABC transporter permease n=1 Tax=Acuticoccus kandeliae TaxID=2073160 RepID=UPI000D3E362E|nr:ABC transporter permease [Acuticoccus kandeliae]